MFEKDNVLTNIPLKIKEDWNGFNVRSSNEG
jgi:hypothetical protein